MPLGNSPLTRAIGMVASVIVALCAAHVAAAPLTNNDYYAARGSELLKSVEQYHLGPGEEHVRAKEYQSAWNDFDFILRAFPNHPQALLLMTQLCTQWRGPKCELNSAFERAIDVNPKASGTFVALGIYLYRTKHYGDAIQSYQRALTIDNDSMNAHYNLGLTYLETKQYELANEHAQRAYALGAPTPAAMVASAATRSHWDSSPEEPDVPGALIAHESRGVQQFMALGDIADIGMEFEDRGSDVAEHVAVVLEKAELGSLNIAFQQVDRNTAVI